MSNVESYANIPPPLAHLPHLPPLAAAPLAPLPPPTPAPTTCPTCPHLPPFAPLASTFSTCPQRSKGSKLGKWDEGLMYLAPLRRNLQIRLYIYIYRCMYGIVVCISHAHVPAHLCIYVPVYLYLWTAVRFTRLADIAKKMFGACVSHCRYRMFC